MAIDALYRDYFQKSKVLLYPLLGIKRGSTAVPEQTYLSWSEHLAPEDMKLIALYPARTDSEYLMFEKNVLLKHNRVCDYIKLNDTNTVVTFDFSDLKDDWHKFLNGQYSKLDIKLKRKIRDHFDKNTGTYTYIDSYLFPERYFSLYADLLGTTEDILRSVGELCSKPDLEKETLLLKAENLQNKKILG
jgi:hypothetical protein